MGYSLIAHGILIKPHEFRSKAEHFSRFQQSTQIFSSDYEVQLADDVIDENQFSEYDELYPEVDAIMDSESDQDEHEDYFF
jgi:hypothetical protein